MEHKEVDLTDLKELLSMQTPQPKSQETAKGKEVQPTTDPTPKLTPKELAQQKAILKVYRKYQQREYERIRHPENFPPDYFFSALAELVLGD